MKNEFSLMVISGIIIGIIASLLVLLGNPANMGFCIACFIRDTAGALRLHEAAAVQYIRPEIIGLILGSYIISIFFKEYNSKGGSSTFSRFILGFFVCIGALVFLGCPLRMVLRISGGDFNAIFGLLGFIIGISIGVVFLKKGFSFGKAHVLSKFEGSIISIFQIIFFILLLIGNKITIENSDNAKTLISYSVKGLGSMHAAIYISLIAGLIVGVLSQRSRMCLAGGIRDVMLFKDFKLLFGFIAIFISCLITNIIIGKFHPGFVLDIEASQPIAHTDCIWNTLSMVLVGFASVLLGGCPLRQLILAGEGNVDSAITIIGFIVGAAIAHNFNIASSASIASGVTLYGKCAVIIGLIITLVIAIMNTKKIN